MADKKISALTGATTPLAGTEVLPIVQSGATVKATVANIVGAGTSPGSFTTVSATLNQNADTTFRLTNTTSGTAAGTSAFIGNGTSVFGLLHYNASHTAYGNLLAEENALYSGAQTVRFANDIANPIWKWTGTAGLTTDYMSLTSTNLTFTGINLVQGTAAKGINFTANTPAAGMSSQLLNWYEEGTWTPTQGAGLTVVGAFSSNGSYVKIGKQVTVTGFVAGATSVALSAGTNLADALPFTASQSPVDYSLGSATNATNSISTTVLTSGGEIFGTDAILATAKIYFTITYISI